MVTQRTLTPLSMVRIHIEQPNISSVTEWSKVGGQVKLRRSHIKRDYHRFESYR
ncbi:hypothetical protein MYOV024v1_p0033 [Vibrio phage PS34B.2]|nr:hypothetical protein MYOV024v1_p0033 [Vibrio phage PS34B.2]